VCDPFTGVVRGARDWLDPLEPRTSFEIQISEIEIRTSCPIVEIGARRPIGGCYWRGRGVRRPERSRRLRGNERRAQFDHLARRRRRGGDRRTRTAGRTPRAPAGEVLLASTGHGTKFFP
jgi:hypothetical protein